MMVSISLRKVGLKTGCYQFMDGDGKERERTRIVEPCFHVSCSCCCGVGFFLRRRLDAWAGSASDFRAGLFVGLPWGDSCAGESILAVSASSLWWHCDTRVTSGTSPWIIIEGSTFEYLFHFSGHRNLL